jgi:hypothetical protein
MGLGDGAGPPNSRRKNCMVFTSALALGFAGVSLPLAWPLFAIA